MKGALAGLLLQQGAATSEGNGAAGGAGGCGLAQYQDLRSITHKEYSLLMELLITYSSCAEHASGEWRACCGRAPKCGQSKCRQASMPRASS